MPALMPMNLVDFMSTMQYFPHAVTNGHQVITTSKYFKNSGHFQRQVTRLDCSIKVETVVILHQKMKASILLLALASAKSTVNSVEYQGTNKSTPEAMQVRAFLTLVLYQL